jgi:hypothetical protein
VELTEQAVDGQTITNMTTDNLVRVRSELDVSLALSVTGSPANYMIRRCRNAVASELDQRGGGRASQRTAGSVHFAIFSGYCAADARTG